MELKACFANSSHKNYICLMDKRADLLRFSPDSARKLQEQAGCKKDFPLTMHVRILILLLFSVASTHTMHGACQPRATPSCYEFCEAIKAGDMEVVPNASQRRSQKRPWESGRMLGNDRGEAKLPSQKSPTFCRACFVTLSLRLQ